MANQSLARIMYGTSEEFHPSTSASPSSLSNLTNSSASDSSDKPADSDPLGELLHRAWTILSNKR
jgi:hypothetical protein